MKLLLFLSLYINLFYSLKQDDGEEKEETVEPLPPMYEGLDIIPESKFLETWRHHEMTDGEIKIIYRAIDKNMDGRVTGEEYMEFYSIFIAPFESECNIEKTYLIKESSKILVCLQTNSFFSLQMTVGDETLERISREVLIYLNKPRGEKMGLNFADYLYLRRVNLAVKKCMVDGKLTRVRIPCAMQIISPGRILDYVDSDDFFELQTMIDKKLYYSKKYLDALSLLPLGNFYYLFNEFELPHKDGKVPRKDFLRALDNQILPVSINHDFVAQLNDYLQPEVFDTLNFKQFGFLIFVSHKFNSFAVQYQGIYIKPEEFIGIFDDPTFDPILLQDIDNFDLLRKELQEEAKNKSFANSITFAMRNTKVKEEDFLMQFLQTQFSYKFTTKNMAKMMSKMKAKSQAKIKSRAKQIFTGPPNPNPKNRMIAFSSFS